MEKTEFCEFVDGIAEMPANTPLDAIYAKMRDLIHACHMLSSPYRGDYAALERLAVIAIKLLGPDRIPTIERLDSEILAKIHENRGSFDMGGWHLGEEFSYELGRTCGTTHCRAGWAIHLGKKDGYTLERVFGSAQAGAIIYMHNTGRVPDFFTSDSLAINDMKRSAAEGN